MIALNSAIHTGYRSLMRSSSMHEPRGPPLEVVFLSINATTRRKKVREREAGHEGGSRVPSP